MIHSKYTNQFFRVFNNFPLSSDNMLPDNVLLSTDVINDLSNFLSQKNYSQVGVLVDEHTVKFCYPLIQSALSDHFVIEIKSGESEKNINTCIEIWKTMTENAMDRHACLVVLGGGVLGDMGGFCAATYKRGINFILIPTTLLAQVDASIGGKLGVDFNHLKNHIGVFQQPALTLLDESFLRSLSRDELRSGFAEVIKHTLISDGAMWKEIATRSVEEQPWTKLIRHSVDFKSYVTTEDPTEKGLRKILNAGHTIGHALETFLLESGRRILHGEAIAVGLITESFIAKKQGLITDAEFSEVCQYLLRVFGKVTFSETEIPKIAVLALQDKKNKGNKILCVLLKGLGNAQWDCEISLASIEEALAFYKML